ncbi:hypothetical protein GCM10010360_39540 [Streptomyces nogalater]
MEKSFGGAAGARPASTPAPTSSTTHSNATGQRLRKENRPSLQRNVAMERAPSRIGLAEVPPPTLSALSDRTRRDPGSFLGVPAATVET